MSARLSYLFLILSFLVAACGGGGGGSSPDTTAPVITLNGPNQYQQAQNQNYIEAGARANDDIDGDISVMISGTIDVNSLGTYILTYTATDTSGNSASVTRQVEVLYKPLITTWKTDNPGQTTSNQILISTDDANYNYNYSVDWGDGTIDNNIIGDITHTYISAGTYTVKISGEFPAIRFETSEDQEKLLNINQWGSIQWQTMQSAFAGCSNLIISATDAPVLSQVTDMRYMFSNASSFNQSVDHWDVSNVTNMFGTFSGASNFNQPLNNWNVSNVISMTNMFGGASNFNQPLNNWNVSNVTNMNGMFWLANSFNQPLNNWVTTSLSGAEYMFYSASSFDQPLGSWNVMSVRSMRGIFSGVTLSSTNYNNLLEGWGAQAASVRVGVEFSGGNSTYTGPPSNAATSRAALEAAGWTITDGGAN